MPILNLAQGIGAALVTAAVLYLAGFVVLPQRWRSILISDGTCVDGAGPSPVHVFFGPRTGWGSRPAVLPWLDISAPLSGDLGGFLENRAEALVRTAMHDAVVVRWAATDRHGELIANPARRRSGGARTRG